MSSEVFTKAPRSILIRAPNWIGDQILAFPFFYHLRKAYPNARIAVVSVPWVEAVQFRGLIDEVITLPRPADGGLRSKLKTLNESARAIAQKGPWDLGVSLPNSLSSAWLLYRAKASRRRGYRNEGRGLFLNDGLALPDETHQVVHRGQSYLDLLPDEARPARAVKEFWGTIPDSELDDKIPGELAKFDADRYWPGERTAPPWGSGEEPYWVLAPGATADSRRWPMEYFIALAREIAKTGLRGIVVGGPKEAPIADRLCAVEELNLYDLTARGPVTGLARIFEKALFTVTNESGLAHVASLCGSFTQIVCGAADPRRTKPLGPGPVQVSLNAVSCWPCERNTCSQPLESKIQCLRGIKPETVWEEIRLGLRKSLA